MKWWAAAAQWRNWPLLVKLAMVLLVPVIGSIVLGVLRVNSDVELADSYADIARIASVRSELVPTLAAIQNERNLAMQQPAGRVSDFQDATEQTDRTIATTDRLIRGTPNLGDAATTGYRNLVPAFESLTTLRELVASKITPTSVLTGYNVVVNSVLNFDRTLVSRFPDDVLSGTSAALYDFQQAHEQVSLQQATVAMALVRGNAMTESERDAVNRAQVRLDDRLADASSVAPSALWRQYLTTVVGEQPDKRQGFLVSVQSGGDLPFNLEDWDRASDITTELMASVASGAASRLQQDSEHLQDSVSNRAGVQAVLLLIMVLLATGIGGVVGRHLLRSLGLLRRTALDVAHKRLPEAVASIRAGAAQRIGIAPVPLRTTEEFGQLARAFDAVNSQAVSSAAEEARLRSNMRNIFMNLSRRSQGLVERQLRLFEQLEQRSEDPEALENLFKLDHLATRMRRNNENLMVLSGMDIGRRTSEPVALVDVLRSAVSEVEQYQRAVVRSAPQVRIVGYAAGDLGRTVAELVENATAFSPPDSQVVITSVLAEDGAVRIEILDSGIGMGDAELADINQRIAVGGGDDVPVSRQMGLFVVGRLTNRHGILARLTRREDAQGLRALVLVPAELVRRDIVSEPVPEAVPEPVGAAVGTSVGTSVGADRGVAVGADGGVAGRLQLAGIVARLPEVPAASSPASILFAAYRPVEHAGPGSTSLATPPKRDFTWLDSTAPAPGPGPRPGKAPSAAAAALRQPAPLRPPAAAEPPAPTISAAGLPKRVPQAHLMASQSTARAARAPASRDAAKARGFLSNFQAGIRRSEQSEGETSP